MTTRAEFLRRIRAEVQQAPGLFAASPAARPARPEDAAALLRRQMAERWPQALDRFTQEFERINGTFHRLEKLEEVPALIRDLARDRAAPELISWSPAELGLDLRAALEPDGIDVTPAPASEVAGARARYREVAARARMGITGADFVLAETGTLILRAGLSRPRSTSLLPETHAAIFGPEQLVETLEQVGVLLEALHADPTVAGGSEGISFITGPSRTADIELTLTRGVHGPREVHAIFVEAR